MAGLTSTTRNTMLSSVFTSGGSTGTAKYASLHTADPGTTGTSEASGGGYARQAITWGAPSSGTTSGGTVTFSVAAGTYAYIGYWDAVTAGNYVGGYALQASMTFGGAGSLPVTLSETLT